VLWQIGALYPFWRKINTDSDPLSPSPFSIHHIHIHTPLAAHDAGAPTDLKWLLSQRAGRRAVPLLVGAMWSKKPLNPRTPET
jgi:hypothetical protein